MIVGQNRERALATARVEAERAAAEAQRVKFVTVDLPRILARSPDQRDRILAVFANMIRDDEMANLTRDEDTVVGEGYEVQRINQGGCANFDTILEFVTNWGRFLYTRDISGTISPSFRVAMQHSCTRGQNRDTRGQNRDEL